MIERTLQVEPPRTHNEFIHDYYSIWFNFIAAFVRSENKVRDIKLKTHYFISHIMS
jgi:hypothetical protein